MITEFKTTFRQDFTIADRYGISAIKDTFKRAFEEWKSNVEYVTELCVVLNWKIWEHYDKGNEEVARVYNDLWEKVDVWCQENLKGKDLEYFYKITD